MKFFPIGYKNGSETGEPDPVPEDVTQKKRKKRRKSRIQVDEADGEMRRDECRSIDEQPEKESVTGELEEGYEEDDDETLDEINEEENENGSGLENGADGELKSDNS